MTSITLLAAAPTPWDLEDRLVGAHSLPLSSEGYSQVRALVQNLAGPFEAVHCNKQNEACRQIAQLFIDKFGVRLRHNRDLDSWSLGLWEGLRRQELHWRFETVMPQWEDEPWTIVPPEGETMAEAIDRLKGAMRSVLKKSRGSSIAIVVRPVALQILRGLLAKESLAQIAKHLQQHEAMATIELSDEALRDHLN